MVAMKRKLFVTHSFDGHDCHISLGRLHHTCQCKYV